MAILTKTVTDSNEMLEQMYQSTAYSVAVLVRCGGQPSKPLSQEIMEILQKQYDITIESFMNGVRS